MDIHVNLYDSYRALVSIINECYLLLINIVNQSQNLKLYWRTPDLHLVLYFPPNTFDFKKNLMRMFFNKK